jgi:membrane fusion protein, multidrug efflux system
MNRDSSPKGKKKLYLAGAAVILVALALLALLLAKQKLYVDREIEERAAAVKAGPEVRVTAAKLSPGVRSVTLVGEAKPYASVTLYAKVSGYLREVRVDKGDRVKAGQLLAVIESPELDRQYDAALADAEDKRRDANRNKLLVAKGYISQQDADHADTAARQSEANAAALKTQKDYEILRAPFAGTVTARFADPGALVQSAVSSQTTALPVVTVSNTERLRVYVYLDQRDAVYVRVGDPVEIADSARPDVRLPASVTRVSGELDARTRTLLTEIELDNRKGAILAGSFVQVNLKLKARPAVEIPAAALLMKDDKAFVAVVTPERRVSFRTVTLSDSDAKTVRLLSGLEDGEVVILNPGWGIAEGEPVQSIDAKAR